MGPVTPPALATTNSTAQNTTGTLGRISVQTVDQLLAAGDAQQTSDGKYVLIHDAVGRTFVDVLLEFHPQQAIIGHGSFGAGPNIAGWTAAYYTAVKTWTSGATSTQETEADIEAAVKAGRQQMFANETTLGGPEITRADYFEGRYQRDVSNNAAQARADALNLGLRFTVGLIPVVGTGVTIYEAYHSKEGLSGNATNIGLSILGDAAMFASFGLSKVAQGATASRGFVVAAKGTIAANAVAQGGVGIYDLYQATQAESGYQAAGYIGSAILRLFGATNDMIRAVKLVPHLPLNRLNGSTLAALRGTGLDDAAINKYLDTLGDVYVFRGTTKGFAGNPALQKLGVTPTSIDPLVATVFAAEGSMKGANPVVYFGRMDAFSDTLEVGNFRKVLEREVTVPLTPDAFAAKAPNSIPLTRARAILAEMGIDVPATFASVPDATQFLEKAPKMTPEQIKKFVELAGGAP
jgi:hypothetical protein